MIIKGRLITAMDFKKDKRVPDTTTSVFTDGKWYVIKNGSGYCNTYEVTGYDDEGLGYLQTIVVKE